MNPKKTKFIWFMLISAAIEIVFFTYITIDPTSNLNFYDKIIDAVLVIILVVFVFKLYSLGKNLLKWTNIAFGYGLLSTLWRFIMGMVVTLKMKIANLSPDMLAELESIMEGSSVSKEVAFEVAKNTLMTLAIVTSVIVVLITILIWVLFYKHLKKVQGVIN